MSVAIDAGTTSSHAFDAQAAPTTVAWRGRPRFTEPTLAAIAARDGVAAAWTQAFQRFGAAAPSHAEGDFAVAIRQGDGRTLLAVDRFGIRPLCYRFDHGRLQFAERADDLASRSDVQPQALLDYLYFHVIPAPRTAFEDVHRLPPGHAAVLDGGRLDVARWWQPAFEERSARKDVDALAVEFRQLLRDAVRRQLDGSTVGCFLSGGTDSSTVAGVLGEVTGKRPATFSIGFDAEGYDEMAYARIAARRFDADHHEYYVTPDDLVDSIPAVAASCDQPFGNSSIVPAFYCAKMAREAGIGRILAGDGGDELFGGNSRYAKQRIFEAYRHVPGLLRRHALEGLFDAVPALGRVPVVRKAASYVEQARVPMPDRMQMYNLLTRLDPARVLTPEFLASVDLGEPLAQQRATYAEVDGTALVNRMLAYDWKYTLADNDLPKVTGATRLAGVAVGFPLLDDRLVDFSLRLPPELKLKGLELRWFFKEALRGFLPDEIIVKKKHGFGLPFGAWLVRGGRLFDLAASSLDGLAGRGIVRRDFIDRLRRDLLPTAPGYYGEMVWILMMLEQWWRRPVAARESRA